MIYFFWYFCEFWLLSGLFNVQKCEFFWPVLNIILKVFMSYPQISVDKNIFPYAFHFTRLNIHPFICSKKLLWIYLDLQKQFILVISSGCHKISLVQDPRSELCYNFFSYGLHWTTKTKISWRKVWKPLFIFWWLCPDLVRKFTGINHDTAILEENEKGQNFLRLTEISKNKIKNYIYFPKSPKA